MDNLRNMNNKIEVGNKVSIVDGSFLRTEKEFPKLDKPYIVYAYPELFGTDTIMKHLLFTVVEVNVVDEYISKPTGTIYNRDVKIEYNNTILYTCSRFLKVHENEESLQDWIKLQNEFDEMLKFDYEGLWSDWRI